MDTQNCTTEESKRLCPACIKNLPSYLFRGKSKFCVECVNLRGVRDAEPATKLTRLDERLKAYGLTYHSYRRLYELQARRCGICSEIREWDGTGKLPFVVDHDHATGKVRGLLCAQCNSGLGFFRDRRDSLINAITYLDRANQRR